MGVPEVRIESAENGYVPENITSLQMYEDMRKLSLKNTADFWRSIGQELHFEDGLAETGEFLSPNHFEVKGQSVQFAPTAKTNICYNCIDRFMLDRDGPVLDGQTYPRRAFVYKWYWEGNYWDEPTHDYADLTWETLQVVVNKCANVFTSKGIKKGDRVLLNLPMVFQLPVAMLACARIGAVHVNVPAGLAAEDLAERVLLTGAELIVTVDGFWRGTELIKSKEIVDRAIEICKQKSHDVKVTLVIKHLSPNEGTPPPELHEQFVGRRPCYFLNAPFNPEHDEWWAENFCRASEGCPIEWMHSEDPLFITFTHREDRLTAMEYTTGGYMLETYASFKQLFDYRQGDEEHSDINENTYWCLHDFSTVTGITYGVYGPLLNGATVMQFEGVLTHPDPGRLWALIQNYQVEKVFLTAENIRMAMSNDVSYMSSWKRDGLKVVACAGEGLTEAEMEWMRHKVLSPDTAFVHVVVSPEMGVAVLSSYPGVTDKLLPCFGMDVIVLDSANFSDDSGYLGLRRPCPAMGRHFLGDMADKDYGQLFDETSKAFNTRIVIRRSDDAYIYLGEKQSLLDIGNTKLSPQNVESILVSRADAADVAVVGVHQRIHVFIQSSWDCLVTDELLEKYKELVTKSIGCEGENVCIETVDLLPRFHNGSVARRILRQMASGDKPLSTNTFWFE